MEALSTSIQTLAGVKRHQLRVQEHALYSRLLYRNKNQHRRALYFHRLDHVRRRLYKVERHPCWRFVSASVKRMTATDAPQDIDTALRLSTLTVADFDNLAAELEELANVLIPKAALRVTTELICRMHFVPFAVAIIAVLARLFAIERALLAAVRAAASSARIAMALSEAAPPDGKGLVHEDILQEDIGEVMPETLPVPSDEKKASPQKPAALPQKRTRALLRGVGRIRECKAPRVKEIAPREEDGVPFQSPIPGDEPRGLPAADVQQSLGTASLYDLMAEQDPALATLAESQVRISLGTTVHLRQPATPSVSIERWVNSSSTTSTKTEAVHVCNLSPTVSPNHAISALGQKVDGLQTGSAGKGEMDAEIDAEDVGPGAVQKGPAASQGVKVVINPETTANYESSDSEDLDDIFAALD